MEILFYAIIASFLTSLISFSGISLFIFHKEKIQEYLILLVALTAGILLGASFFHFIPEAIDLSNIFNLENLISYFILFGILSFFIIEKFIHWHHHHDISCKAHKPAGTLILIGDSIGNFIDGVLIGAAFLVDISFGIMTTIVIMLHEIPQEIGNLAILLRSGFKKNKALFYNFLSALFSVVGTVIGVLIFSFIEEKLALIIAFASGAFIYIALADITPELHISKDKQFLINLFFFLGILLMYLFSLLE